VLLSHFVSKVTHRQSARLLSCSRKTVLSRVELLGRHARELHTHLLERARPSTFDRRSFQLDELETFEHSRRLAPLTVPVLIDRVSRFVLDARVAPLPARGDLRPSDRRRKLVRESTLGKRKSGSRAAVAACFEQLAKATRGRMGGLVQTDRKSSYRRIVRDLLPGWAHERFSSKLERSPGNPLFAINHTLAMLRDGLSRLVRRTWAGPKRASALDHHVWIWIAWRNYVRPITNRSPQTSSAMALGVLDRKLSIRELLGLRARYRR
jgi:hypothetical protein